MMTKHNDWKQFCERAAAVMRDALSNKISLEDASDFFEKDKAISDPDLRRYVQSMVWEIDGSRKYYLELLELFARGASQDDLVSHLNSRASFWVAFSEKTKATIKSCLSKLGISRG